MTSQNIPTPKKHLRRISLVAGAILIGVTLLVGTTVFVVMARNAEELLSKSLQVSLQDRVQLIQAEIGAGVDQATLFAARPLLMDLVQRVNAGTDEGPARVALDTAFRSFLPTGLTAIALLDQDGRKLAHAGFFTQQSELTVPLHVPGLAQLKWDGQLMLHSEVDMTRNGRVIGKVITQMKLPVSTGALKDVRHLGKAGELALCASLGSSDVQCFPTTLAPKSLTVSKTSAQGVSLPITHALEGETGFMAARDYRNRQVVAAYAPVGSLGLGMVLKMDSGELYAPVWLQVPYLIPLLAGALVIALLLLRWGLRPLVNSLLRSEARANEMNASLRDSERRGRALLDNVDEGIITISDSGTIELFNPAAERMFGYRSEEVVGRNVSMLMAEPYRSEHDGYLGRYLRTGQARVIGIGFGTGRELAGLRSDGAIFPTDLRISEFHLEGRRHFVGSLRDISEHKRITEALRSSETQLRQIADTVPALIAHLDLEQRFRFHNKAYEEVLGLSFGQINGRTLAEVLGPEVHADIRAKVDEVLRGYPVHYERVLVTPQGDPRNYTMHFLPRYGEGANEGKVIGFFSLGTDITELKRIDRMKTEFVSTVSHELRTPLTSIRGSLGLIAGGVAGELPQAAKSLVAIAESNCERLIRLINDILDSEKIESGKMRLNLQSVEIRQVVQQSLAANEGFAGKHRVTMRLRAPDPTLKVRIDSDRMIQVLTNLLSNAVKFSPPDGKVEVSVFRVAGGVRVEVVDQGPGIPEAFRARIFQKFSQADSSDIRQTGGTGLGLNISRALVDKMGGQLGFSSVTGAGATFFIELPEWRDEVALPASFPVRSASPRPRILICEGDQDVARLIAMMLDRAGFDFDMTHSAEQALACLARTSYDAVTLELKLPDRHGTTLISSLRGNERTRKLPVVVISAMAEEGLLQFNHGPLTVSDWLEKPIDERLLVSSVRRAVASMASGKPRILHVDDDPDIQRITEAIAHDFADFEFASLLEQARTRLHEQRFDLVLLDLTLGEDSGWDLIEDINALDPRPPVIVFSARDVDPADRKHAEAVLVKARTSNLELLNTIQRVLQIPGNPGPALPNA